MWVSKTIVNFQFLPTSLRNTSILIMTVASKVYGKRLIPNIIDERARDDPERPVYSIPILLAMILGAFKISPLVALYTQFQ